MTGLPPPAPGRNPALPVLRAPHLVRAAGAAGPVGHGIQLHSLWRIPTAAVS